MSEEQQVDASQTNTEETSTENVLYDNDSKESKTEGEQEVKASEAEEAKDDAKTTEAEPKESNENTQPEEVKYELKVPKETLLPESVVEDITAIAKEQGLSNDQAQKMLDMQSEALSQYSQTLSQQFNEQVTTWGEEIKADKELGGDNLTASAEYAKRAVTEFAGEEFLQELDTTGYGNHPKLFKMLVNIGKELEASDLVVTGSQGNDSKSFADKFYPNIENKD